MHSALCRDTLSFLMLHTIIKLVRKCSGPLITTTVPLLYFDSTVALQLCPGKFSAMMTIAATSITFFNPLTTVLFLRCYRQVVVQFFTCGKKVRPRETSAIAQSTSNAVPKSNEAQKQ
ncbi:hypothetical protein Ddc_24821 [Ditylenchus destructor]|nr:hypothetical protein Ddc_24821 [Ditylenchus destructor]